MTTELAKQEEQGVELPASAKELDKKLVDEAATFIKTTFNEAYQKSLTEVGEYVLEKFFDNDVALARSQDPGKHVSYKSLAELCGSEELPISRTWLHNAVSLVITTKALPDGKAFKQLSHSHQITLLPLKDLSKIEKLAEKAVTKELSVRDLRETVAHEKAKASEKETRGRPVTPALVKAFAHSMKAFTFEGGRHQITKALVDELDEDQAKEVLASAEDLVERLNGLIEKLKKSQEA